MRVFEAMTEGVRTVPPTMSASAARELMRTAGVHHLVVTERNRVVGVLSDRDVGRRPSTTTVADLMTTPVVTIARTETLRKAANLMRGRTIGCLPVTDGGRLVGIVTTSDLLTLIGMGGDRPAHNARASLSHRVPHRKVHLPTGSW